MTGRVAAKENAHGHQDRPLVGNRIARTKTTTTIRGEFGKFVGFSFISYWIISTFFDKLQDYQCPDINCTRFPSGFQEKKGQCVMMSPTSSYTVRLLFTRPVDRQNNAIVRALKLITFVKEKLLLPTWGLHKEWSYQIWETKTTSQRFFYDEGSWSISSKIPPSLYCDHTHLQPGKHLMRSPCYFYGGSFLFETAINKNYKCQVLHGACALFHRKRHTPHTNAAIIVHPSSEPRVFWRHERNGLAAYCHEAVRLKQQRRLGRVVFFRTASDCLDWRKRDWQFVCMFTGCNLNRRTPRRSWFWLVRKST